MYDLPSFLEDDISKIPALQLLHNLGYVYLTRAGAAGERNGRLSHVLLDGVLAEQLRRINRVTVRGRQYEFSGENVRRAVQALKDVPDDGLIRTNEQLYDLLSLGKSFEETVDGDTKSYQLRYVDWEQPKNNVFHVVEEFDVERTASKETCRPDLVLFVNGIPFAVIECKRPDLKDALEQAISQQIRNQGQDYIPKLFTLAQLLLAVDKNAGRYGTVGTARKFWSEWKERRNEDAAVARLINRPLAAEVKRRLFANRNDEVRGYFDALEQEGREVTAQDRILYSLCRPERLIELARKFVVFDAGEKKIARYQQYFAIQKTLERVRKLNAEGGRTGGVVWHTQGSGKSLTMVMLAKAIALDPAFTDPRIVLVTDRVDLDDQIYRTFTHCGLKPEQATTGRHLLSLLAENKAAVITTVIDKFDAASRVQQYRNDSPNIFLLVDEAQRSQYGETHARMRQLLPNACLLGFTGTPLLRQEKHTAARFGGIIDSYTIDEAVRDKAVVPLLYEGRHVQQEVDERAIDKWFEIVSRPLSRGQRADLKRRMASKKQLNEADRKIYLTAYDISEHFADMWKGTGFKGQLAASSKRAALRFKEYLDEFGRVSSTVLISGPDTREGNDDVETAGQDEVQAFWKRMMERYGSERAYNKTLIQAFKQGDEPEIIIVVDKLLTGFDAPRNTVLYLAKSLKEHSLLQAIARVNRLAEGKDFGYIIDYWGVLGELNEALNVYSALSGYEAGDVAGCLTEVGEEVKKLPQRHSELWDVFKTVRGKRDEEAYERLLGDEELREQYYAKFAAYHRTLAVALSAHSFMSETPAEKVERYKRDLAFFQKLRVSVKRRYAEEIDFREYEARVQKLINTHVSSNEVMQITPPVNIFDREKFQAEVERLESTASKADTIAHRTKRTIAERMEEDPFFYRRFSKILADLIEAHREERISDAEYLSEVMKVMVAVRDRTGDDLPPELQHHEASKAFYGVVKDVLGRVAGADGEAVKQIAAEAALQIDELIRVRRVVDWTKNADAQNEMRNAIDDYLYRLKEERGLTLGFDEMDLILDQSLSIAKTRYAA